MTHSDCYRFVTHSDKQGNVSGHPSRRWIGPGEAAPHPLGAVFRGEVEKGRSWTGHFLWVPPGLVLHVRVGAGRILQFRSSFLEGAGSATQCFPAWRHPHSCQEKTAAWLLFKEGKPQSCRGAGQDAIGNRNSQASSPVGKGVG